jgi:hypothetical protein
MDKHNGVLFNHKEHEVILFAGKWMELEIIMVSEISQTEKNKHHIFSFTQGI